jgi:hypothetical protein
LSPPTVASLSVSIILENPELPGGSGTSGYSPLAPIAKYLNGRWKNTQLLSFPNTTVVICKIETKNKGHHKTGTKELITTKLTYNVQIY